ncbi:MAG TPA: alpha/beta fold hydrolase [Verrucomicrobiae bacterium]
MRFNLRLLFVLAAATMAILPLRAVPMLPGTRVEELRKEIRADLFVPDPLPPLDATVYRTFTPAPGVRAEAVSYTSQFGVRVPAILYLPDPLPKGKIPAFVVVNGHGGDKYSWYAFYTGILFARGGAAVLTYDMIGEGERNTDHKSDTRQHDTIGGGPLIARRLAGLMITDAMQAVSYLRARPEVDPDRIVVGGYSLGSFVVSFTGALDTRIHACVLCAGGTLDGPGGYWDSSTKLMCQAYPYQSLNFLGDRPAVIYALQAARGPAFIFNGLGDTTVQIPSHGTNFFADLHARTIQLHGGTNDVFEYGFAPTNSGHRPYWVTRPVVEWLGKQNEFPNWTEAQIQSMPTVKIGDWTVKYGIAMDKLFAVDSREAGTPALDVNVPGFSRDELDALPPDQWAEQKTNFILEGWVAAAQKDEASDARNPKASN